MESRKKHLIYCPVFKNELQAVLPRAENLTCHALDYDVHHHPGSMLTQLNEAIGDSQKKGCEFSLLVGKDCECTIPIGTLADENNGRLPDHMNCFEIFLGRKKTLELQQNRTVLMTPGWIEMITNLVADGRWTVEDARLSLGWYDRILLLDTQLEPLDDEAIMEFYDLVQVPIEFMTIDLDHFRGVVEELLK